MLYEKNKKGEKKLKKTQKKQQTKKTTNKKNLLLIEIVDFLSKKTYYVGFDEKNYTKKYLSKTSFLNANSKYKNAFNKGILKVKKVEPTTKGVRNYV